MNQLTALQVKDIRKRLVKGGITDPELLDDVLDHYCCAIEEELQEGISLENAFGQVHQRISPNGAKEIQIETDFLLNYKYLSTMRKLMYFLGFLSAFVFSLGWLMNILHLAGGQLLFMSGPLIFTAGFLPVYITYQIRDKDKKTVLEWVTYSSGAIVAAVLSIGGVFKINHLAGANIMLILGMGTLIFAFLPSLFLLLYKKSEEREMIYQN